MNPWETEYYVRDFPNDFLPFTNQAYIRSKNWPLLIELAYLQRQNLISTFHTNTISIRPDTK